jgi:hypothetical protein
LGYNCVLFLHPSIRPSPYVSSEWKKGPTKAAAARPQKPTTVSFYACCCVCVKNTPPISSPFFYRLERKRKNIFVICFEARNFFSPVGRAKTVTFFFLLTSLGMIVGYNRWVVVVQFVSRSIREGQASMVQW